MVSGFGTGGHNVRRGEKDRVLFIAAAFMAFSLLVVVMIFFFKNSSEASASNNKSTNTANSTNNLPTLGMVKVLVPSKPVTTGTKLSNVEFREMFWPRNNIPEGTILDKNELKELYSKTDLPAGQPVTRINLTSQQAQATLPVTPGNRAVTIDVDATSGLEGFAQPGTKVDIVLTYTDGGELTSKVIVQNARVLSAGGDTKPTNTMSEKGGWESSAKNVRTITLDVAPADALRITTSRQMGSLNLIMRSRDDNTVIPTDEVEAGKINNKNNDKNKGAKCSRGHVKVNGTEFVLGCDGSMTAVEE